MNTSTQPLAQVQAKQACSQSILCSKSELGPGRKQLWPGLKALNLTCVHAGLDAHQHAGIIARYDIMNMLLHKAVNVCHPEAGHSATCRPADGTQAEAAAVNADNSTWSLDEEVSASGERSKVLSILLATATPH